MGTYSVTRGWRPVRQVALLVSMLAVTGCAVHRPAGNRACVSADLEQRSGFALGSSPCGGQAFFPNGASLDDGLEEDEAVLVALWNNAAFHETLVDLKIARGDLVQAGLLPNPEVGYFFSAPHKPFKYVIDMPLEALWLRPIRVAAAEHESQRVCQRLIQVGLDLIRDVRQAYADVLLAQGRANVAAESVRVHERIARLAESRLEHGDISAQEAAAANIDVLRAKEEAGRVDYDVTLAANRLRQLMGVGQDCGNLTLNAVPPPEDDTLDVDALTAEAVATRPDALAACQNAAAAAERVRLAKRSWVRFLGILDATSGRQTGHEFSPGFRATLPLFNHNQGAIARAEAECLKAERQRQTIHDQIVLDVHQAHCRYEQARTELEFLDCQVKPATDKAIERAGAAYREGETTYVVVLQTTRQLLDTRLRREQVLAELRRAWAELERSIGHTLGQDCTAEVTEAAQP